MENPVEKQKQIDSEIADAKAKISAIPEGHSFGHNIITSILQGIGGKYGYKVSDEIIKELDLASKFAIYPIGR